MMPQGGTAPGQLFDSEHTRQKIHPGAAMGFGHGHTHKPTGANFFTKGPGKAWLASVSAA